MAKDARTYWEKLQDPKWQQMRLRVLERAEFTCEMCGSKERTLHVHHGYYEKARDPWEYPFDTLHCLCEFCHENIAEYDHDVRIELARLPVDGLREAFDAIRQLRDKFPRTYKPCLPGWWDDHYCEDQP